MTCEVKNRTNKPKRRADDGRECMSPAYYFYCCNHRRTAERSSCSVHSLFRSVVRAGGPFTSLSSRTVVRRAYFRVIDVQKCLPFRSDENSEITGNMTIWILSHRAHIPRGGPRPSATGRQGVLFCRVFHKNAYRDCVCFATSLFFRLSPTRLFSRTFRRLRFRENARLWVRTLRPSFQ